jgi:hypothetical protein
MSIPNIVFQTQHIHFQQFRAINANTGPFADNLSGENEVLEDLLMNIGEGAAARSLLLDA